MIASSSSSPPTRMDCETTMPPSEITATSEVPPPMSTTMLPVGSPTGRPAPIAAAIGSSIRYACRAPADRQASSTARFSTPVTPDGTQTTTRGCAQRFWWTFWMKWRSISSVTSKSAMTPSFSGRMAWIVPGVRPSIRLASMPTACTSEARASIAPPRCSENTIPPPRTYTSVFAVPRSTAMSRPPKPVRYEKKPIYRKGQTREARSGACTGTCGPLRRQKLNLAGAFEQANELGHRKTDHIPEIAVDSLNQSGAAALDRVAAGAPLPLARFHVLRDLVAIQITEVHPRGGDRRQLALSPGLGGTAEDQPTEHLVHAAGQKREHFPRCVRIPRLAKHPAVDADLGVAGQHAVALDRVRLAARVLEDDEARVALGQLLRLRGTTLDLEPELLEDRPPLRGRAREDQASSGKNSAASRVADSFESEP